MAAFRAPVCFINLGLIPDRNRYWTYLYYLPAYLLHQVISPAQRDQANSPVRNAMSTHSAQGVGIGLSVEFDSGLAGSTFVVSSISPGEAAARDGSIGLSLLQC